MIKLSSNYGLSLISIIIGLIIGLSPIRKLKLFPFIVSILLGIKFLTK